jgi:hypothetical protein
MTVGLEAVLRAQGMPSSARRPPRVVAASERALREGLPQLAPSSVTRRFAVEQVTHSRVRLAGGGALSGPLPVARLAAAREVLVVAATVGATIGDAIRRLAGESAPAALALEGVATAGVESWVAKLREELQEAAAGRGWCLTASLSPGQRELFALLGTGGPVRLLEGGMMWPRHSLSFVVGLGPDVPPAGVPCDWCGARSRCRHRPLAP